MTQTDVTRLARITKALMKLGAARREKLDKVDFETYVEGMAEFAPEIVEQVCADFARVAPDEFQPRFPPLHLLRETCHKTAERLRERRLALNPAPEPEPLTDAQWLHLQRLFRQKMPGSPIPSWLQPKAKEREA